MDRFINETTVLFAGFVCHLWNFSKNSAFSLLQQVGTAANPKVANSPILELALSCTTQCERINYV